MTARTTTTTTTTTKTPVLLWSEQGQIGCALPGHAPYTGSDTWAFDGWRKITPGEAAAFQREVGRPPSCETCDTIARRQSDKPGRASA